MDIQFVDSNGRTAHKRLFTPTGENPKQGESITDALKRKEDANITALVGVLRELVPEAIDTLEAADYKSFVDKAVSLLNGVKGIKVNLKVTPDYVSQKWPELPYDSYVEKFIPGVETKLSFSKKELGDLEKYQANAAAFAAKGSNGNQMTTESLGNLV